MAGTWMLNKYKGSLPCVHEKCHYSRDWQFSITYMPLRHGLSQVLSPLLLWVEESRAALGTGLWAEPWQPPSSHTGPFPVSAETLPVGPTVQVQSHALQALASTLTDTASQALCWLQMLRAPPNAGWHREGSRGALQQRNST